MRKLTALFALLFVLAIPVKSQSVAILDANFATWLQQNYPTCMSGNMLDTQCNAIFSVQTADLYNKGISNLYGIQFFPNLQTLNCQFNNLTFILDWPPNLREVDCSNNNISTFSAFPANLRRLSCTDNNLSSLPALHPNMERLEIGNNPISPANVPALANTITSLGLNGLGYTSATLPTMPPNLLSVALHNNPLGSLPALPNSLQFLSCGSCSLTSLPQLPNNLIVLDAPVNAINSVTNLPASLVSIKLSGNQLTSLPPLTTGLTVLDLQNNQLTCLPELPVSLQSVKVSFNPLTCVPNYLPAMQPFALSLPLCLPNDPVNNPNGCVSVEGISGYTFSDANGDCDRTGIDPVMENIPLRLYDNANNLIGLTSSASNGVYMFNAPAGTYRVEMDTVNTPFTFSCPNPGYDSTVVLPVASPFALDVDFEIACKSGFDVGGNSIVPFGWVFPGQPHTLKVGAGDMSNLYGLSCTAGVSGQVEIVVSGPVTYGGPGIGARTPTVSGNTFTYAISAFDSVNFDDDFALVFTTNTTAQAGDQICVTVNITPTAGDNDISNNTLNICYDVVNSYDPNEKEVYPTQVDPGYTGWLNYTIHFQNTGSAPAFNISLLDTLNPNLDWHTFQYMAGSHSNTFELQQNVLSFDFANILLPDSTSDPEGSKGYVQFRIRPIAGLPDGTQVGNKVSIYFDFNAPIVTNTAVTVFGAPVGLPDPFAVNPLQLFPNPSSGTFNGQWLGAQRGGAMEISIFNAMGQVVLNQPARIGKDFTLDLSNQPNGVYFLHAKSGNSTYHQRLLLQH